MLAIGIDPGTATTGYGLVRRDEAGNLTAVDWGVILTAPVENASERLARIHKELEKLLKKHNPECAAVESLFFQRNVRTAMSVGQARGVVLLALQQAGIPSYDYNPNQVKQAVSGYGAADKRQMQSMVQTLLRLPDLPKPDDAADALAIAICHLNTHRTQQAIASAS
ncbi:MAG TPA: crossover junction endodeoxyribonuclease RuvC [Anaerolineales bacterium]|nr:crossover junction endodeoxyribonuclease RuvC [Anaerolineales bacterium]